MKNAAKKKAKTNQPQPERIDGQRRPKIKPVIKEKYKPGKSLHWLDDEEEEDTPPLFDPFDEDE